MLYEVITIEIYSGTDNFVDFAGKATGTYNYKVIATKTGYADSPETRITSYNVCYTKLLRACHFAADRSVA